MAVSCLKLLSWTAVSHRKPRSGEQNFLLVQ